MDDVISTFPLLRLPKKAVLNTLRTMMYLEMFGISLLSKKIKNLVESLKITAEIFQVEVSNKFEVTLFFIHHSPLLFKFYDFLANQPLQELGTPENIFIECAREMPTWKNSMSVKELLEHLKFIFHSSITLDFHRNCERFSLESIHKNVRDFKNIGFYSGNHEYNKRIFSLFKPASIFLGRPALIDLHVPKYILIQNFDVIEVPLCETTLDELLMTNSRVIHLTCDRLSIKIPNRFLKLRMKGSCPRLEYMNLEFSNDEFQIEDLLRGLKFEDAPRDGLRRFNNSAEEQRFEVTGGWDILRCDGTKATIRVYVNEYSVTLCMCVWHDHCIGN